MLTKNTYHYFILIKSILLETPTQAQSHTCAEDTIVVSQKLDFVKITSCAYFMDSSHAGLIGYSTGLPK